MREDISPFQVKVRYIERGVVLDLSGIVNKSAQEPLLTLFEERRCDPEFVVFNFTGVTYINSQGISILIRIIKALLEPQSILLGYGVNSLQEKLFKAVGITRYISLYPDEYSILQRIGNA